MLGPGLAFRLRGIPLQGPLDTGHPDHWLSQSHHCKPLSKCRGAGHFPWLPPVSLPTPLATTEGQSSENKAIPAQESQDPASRPALPQGAVWPWTSHWASLGHNFPMGIWTGSVREFGLGQWGNLDWVSEGIWIGQCFSNNYCLQLGPGGRAEGQRQKCESPAPSVVGWCLFHQNHCTVGSLAKSSLNSTSHLQPRTLSSKAFPSCDTMNGIYPPGHRRYNQSRESQWSARGAGALAQDCLWAWNMIAWFHSDVTSLTHQWVLHTYVLNINKTWNRKLGFLFLGSLLNLILISHLKKNSLAL